MHLNYSAMIQQIQMQTDMKIKKPAMFLVLSREGSGGFNSFSWHERGVVD